MAEQLLKRLLTGPGSQESGRALPEPDLDNLGAARRPFPKKFHDASKFPGMDDFLAYRKAGDALA